MPPCSRLILVRHGRPLVTDGVLPSEWPLAEDSQTSISILGREMGLSPGAILLSSTEPKALATAEALALQSGVRPTDGLREVTKPWFEREADLQRATRAYLAGQVLDGWEPLPTAVERFDRVVARLERPGVVVVTHGTIMTAWLASAGLLPNPFEFWQSLGQPDAWEVRLGSRGLRRLL